MNISKFKAILSYLTGGVAGVVEYLLKLFMSTHRMKKFLTIFCALPLAGCLWICRVPFPVVKQYSEDGECTNRIWRSMITDCRIKGYERSSTNFCFDCYYPTIVMRCKAWHDLYGEPIDPELKGEDLYKAKWRRRMGWFPIGLAWIGAPLDALVDTILLPYDYFTLPSRQADKKTKGQTK